MNKASTSVSPYGKSVKVVLLAYLIIAVVQGLSEFGYVFIQMDKKDVFLSDLSFILWETLSVTSTTRYVVLLLCVVCTLMWQYKCYNVVRDANRYAISTIPEATLVFWIVPPFSFYIPYRTISEIYMGSDATDYSSDYLKLDSVPLRYKLWWALYLISFVFFPIRWEISKEYSDGDWGLARYNMIGTAIWVACGSIFYLIVDDLTRRVSRFESVRKTQGRT